MPVLNSGTTSENVLAVQQVGAGNDHNIPTLQSWHTNLFRDRKALGDALHDDAFKRMWTYYLKIFPPLFKLDIINDLQILFSKI